MSNWTYKQTTGELFNPDGVFVAKGYAGGNLGKNPEGKNNPDMQFVHNVGPLPQGWYTIEPPIEHSTVGLFALPLTPDPENNMGGRGHFYIHGDLIGHAGEDVGSEGCVVMPNATRHEVASSGNNRLEVVA